MRLSLAVLLASPCRSRVVDVKSAEGGMPDFALACPDVYPFESTAIAHDCTQEKSVDEQLTCCVDTEGRGLDSLDPQYVEEFLLPELNAAGIDEADLISQAAALCVADVYGLLEGPLGRGADLAVVEGEARWTVKSWVSSSCAGRPDGALGDVFGCGAVVDATTGEAPFPVAVSGTIMCGAQD